MWIILDTDVSKNKHILIINPNDITARKKFCFNKISLVLFAKLTLVIQQNFCGFNKTGGLLKEILEVHWQNMFCKINNYIISTILFVKLTKIDMT